MLIRRANITDIFAVSALWCNMVNAILDLDLTTAGVGFNTYKLGLLVVVAQQMNLFLTNQATTPQNNGQFIRELASNF